MTEPTKAGMAAAACGEGYIRSPECVAPGDVFPISQAYSILNYERGQEDQFFRDFCATRQDAESSKACLFRVECHLSMRHPTSNNEMVPPTNTIIIKSEVTIPKGAIQRGMADPVFNRTMVNKITASFLDDASAYVSGCVVCGQPHIQRTKSTSQSMLQMPNGDVGLYIVLKPCYSICGNPVCMARAMEWKETDTKKEANRNCSSCGKYEPPGTLSLKQCQGCKIAYYCNAECQKKHWKTHRKVCKAAKKHK